MPNKTDFDKVKDLLIKLKVDTEIFSPDGICPSITVHFDDKGMGRKLDRKKPKYLAVNTEEKKYPCQKCGKLRTKAEGGTVFTVCDDCWG